MNHNFRRKSNRLQDYDYSQSGLYFITICTKQLSPLLGTVVIDSTSLAVVQLSETGIVVESKIQELSTIYDCVHVDCHIVMPNHVHMIIAIDATAATNSRPPTISRIINQWKGAVTKHLGKPIWHKSFHDHILRNQLKYDGAYTYICNNPAQWALDRYNLSKTEVNK